MKYVLLALQQYSNFRDRSGRLEYWYFALFHTLLLVMAFVLDQILGFAGEGEIGLVYLITIVALLLPSTSVSVRRLHDIGKSGVYLFLVFIPVIGWIWLIIWFCRAGTPGPNKWGAHSLQISPSSM